MTSFDSSDEDDPFSVSKSFKIPKQARSSDLLQAHAVGSSDYKHVIGLVAASLKLGADTLKHISIYTVNNEQLERRYATRKGELKKEADCASEMYAFLRFSSLKQATDASRDGLSVGNVSTSPLASAKMGVTLFRHADVLTPSPPSVGDSNWLLICKVFPGRVRAVAPCLPDNQVEPDPNLDSYTSAGYNQPQSNYAQLYHNSQIYLFEYDLSTYDIVPRPRHVLPYAIVECKLASALTNLASEQIATAKPASKTAAVKRPLKDGPADSSPTKPAKITAVPTPPLKRPLASATAAPALTLPSHLMIPLGQNSKSASRSRPSL